MPAVEITLTTEQLISAYAQLSQPERRSFLTAIFDQPTNQEMALDLLVELHETLRRKFPPGKQRLLDRLLDANAERKLSPKERQQLEQLIAEYGEGLIEKARARYVVETSRRAGKSAR